MRFFKTGLMFMVLLILLLCAGNVFSADINDLNSTIENVDSNNEILKISTDDSLKENSNENDSIFQQSGEIEVETWEDIQYYSSLTNDNYVLKLKENTNYYPADPESTDYQIIFNNNVTIIGAEGAYFGDTSPNARNITYTAMKVAENSGNGITLKGITFKWISTRYQPDGVFCEMGGNAVNYIDDCYFTNISTNIGHSSILHIKLGDAVVTNCTFINCTTDFGCLSVYNPKDDPTQTCVLARMNVTDSYFESNYARTEPGCINNCGILVVRNSTFHKNSAFWWAGAIHTHGGANTTLYDCIFTDNVAGWNGGALYTYSYLQIYNTTFIGNNCTTNNGGGAIGACKYLHAPYIIIKDSLFKDNTNNCWGLDELSTSGTGRGGAISLMDEGLLDVRNTTFIKNSASIGTAICAINGGLQMGSPDVIIVGNRFINHTRVGDVLNVRLATNSYLEINDNYYYNNSFEFKKLRLVSDEKIGDDVVVHIDAELKNPNSFESDILDTTPYDIYVDGVYNKTVIGKTFTLNLKDGKTCHVYAVPSISNSKTNEIFVGVPKEYVYVSQKSGKDTNNGLTRTSPVKTISKAIELARTKGNIIIMDGTYNEGNFTVDYNLTISGENNVKFSGNYALTIKNIFTVTNADLSISGITFDNIVMTADTSNKDKRIIQQTSGYLTIDDCTFNKISPNGNSGMVLIEAKNIAITNSKFTNNNKASVYVTPIKSDEFLVDNCSFTNNLASHTTYKALISTSNTKTGVKGTITDSIFENNKVKYGCVYFGAAGAPLTITNTKFISNTVGSTSDHATAIKIEESPVLRVDQCLFKDNVNLGTRAAVIYSAGGSGSVYVSNSVVINNSYANNNGLVFSASTENNLKVYKNLNANWWGNTLENYDVAPAVYQSACNNWIVLNMTANTTKLAYNQKALVSIDFYNTIDRQGNFSFVDASKLPGFDLDVAANNGVASASKINVVKGIADVEYTLKSYDSGSLTVSYGDVDSTIDFVWSLVDPNIEINVENNTYGNPTDITINVPGDMDAGKFSLKINNNPYSFNNAITIPKLNAGDYLINLTYSGDAKYNKYAITKLFNIEKATPQLTIDVKDIYYPNSAQITVNAGDATGQITINVNDKTDSKTISSGKAEFIVANLQANNYTVEATYSGDGNYISGRASADFKVKKYNSTITISHGNVVVGNDVTLTFTVKSDASGTVTVDINGKKETVGISGGKATYTIKSISRGLYDIVATYNGDAKYLISQNTTQLDVARLTPNLNVAVSSVTYGQDAVFTITLNNDASGSITVLVDGKNETASVNNGVASLNMSGLNAGNNKQASIVYSGDNTYKPKETSKTFNVAKAKPEITIDAADIKEGQVSNVQITVTRGTTGTIELVTPAGTETPQVPRTGLFTRTFSDLTIGQYTVSVNYGGDSNFLSASASKTFTVSAWDNPQWPNEGYDVKNTGKSPYFSESNGNIAWVKDIDGTIIGNMAIDSQGNLYITTSNGIYSINAADGSTNWIFNSQDAGNNFSGIAIGRDTVLAPKSGDKLYFINQTTGEQFHNNIYQGSSLFAPIVDGEGNIYTSGEYYEFEDSTNLVVIPYKIWQTSTAPVSIGIGSYNITSSPVLVDKNNVFLKTANGLISIDLSSKIINFNRQMAIDSNLVVGIGNITYFITNGHVKGYDVNGIEMCDVAITGTAGNYLSVGVNGEIFSITKEGKLFEYSTGEETLIYDFKEPVSSRLLVGQDDKLFVGSNSGMFYAIDVEGNLLWQVNLNQSISNSSVMDKNGVIYVVSGNRIVAIDKINLKDSQLSAEINNVNYKEDVKVDITITSQATGVVSIKVGDVYTNQTAIGNGQISFTISNLNVGNYTAKISYAGDARYKSNELNVPFMVLKLDPTMDVNADNINVGEVLNVNVVDLPKDATGTVQITVGGIFNNSTISNGQANLLINGLTKGEYPYTVTYLGDANYNSKSITKSVSVGYVQKSFIASAGDINVGQDCVIKVTGLPNDANGIAFVTLNNRNYTEQVKSGSANVVIPDLPNGTYNLEVRYINDTKYSANPQKVSFKVSKITPTFTATVNDIYVGDNLIVDVSGLPDDATGLIIASVEKLSENSSVGNGNTQIIIPQNLANGTYSVNITYSGDNKYNNISTVKTVKISKKTPSYSVSISNIYVGDDLIVDVESMPVDCEGTLTASISGFSNSSNIKNGISIILISEKLANGTYPVEITYSGDAKYDGFKTTKNVIISKKAVEMSVNAKDNIIIGENLTITVSNLPVDGSRYVYILGEIQAQGEIRNGVSNIVISGLTEGKYSYNIYYPDDERYIGKTIGKTVNVDKITPQLTVNASNVKNIDDDLTIIVSNLPSDGADYIIISGDYEGIITITNGTAKAVVSGLTKGSYSFNIQYPGSDKYNEVIRNLVVDVGKVDVNYTVKCSDVSYGNPAIFEISGLPSDATGLITVIINHNEYSNNVSDGKTSINVLNLPVNKYDAEIRYSNDEIYMADPKVISFNVTKANPTINVAAENIKYGEDLVVNINLNKDASGILNVTVGDISKTVYVVNGVASATFSDLNANNQTINVYYGGDENYNSISTSRSITVSKINPKISAKVDNIKYGENLTVRISLPKDATGNVTVKVDGKTQTVVIERGNAIAVISGLTAGKKSVSVSYSGDKKYNLNSYSTSAIIDKITPIITISADNIKYGESAKINVKISDNISGNIVISVGDLSKTVKAIGGIASTELSGLAAGSKLITAKFNGDSIYNENSASKTITVSKITPDLTVNANDIKYGEDLVIDVNLNNDCSGNVVISVGDVSKTITLKNGVASVKFSNLPAGENNIIVKYDGDDNYYSDSKSKQISVSKIDTPVIILADDIKYGENLVVKVNLNKDAKGNVIVSVDDIHQSINIINGSATATISSLTSGDKVINVRYLGDEKYNSCTASKNIAVSKATSLITVPIDVKITDNSRAEISMNNVSGNVSVIVDGEEIIVPLNDGKASVDLKGLSSGNHSIIVVYDGDDTYAPSHNSSSFNVPQTGIVPIASEFRDITVNDDLTISFVLKDKNGNVIANAPVSYTIDGAVSSKTTDSKGSFAVPSKDGVAISVNYVGNGTFKGTDLRFTFNGYNVPVVLNIASRFNIPNRVITINGYAVDAKAGEEGIYYSTNLLDSDGKPIKGANINFAVNNKIYNRTTDEKGGFDPYKLNMIRAGRYTMAFYFAGDDSHTPAFACVCVDLAKKPISISASAKTFKASATKKYTVTLSTIVGSSHDGKVHLSPKEVTLTVNGKTYSGKTNNKGQVTFNLKITKKGTYMAKISYEGDSTYDLATKSVKLTIK